MILIGFERPAFMIKLKLFAKSARNISIFVSIGVVLIGTITGTPSTGRYAVRINLDDLDTSIPQGAGSTVAVYTQRGKPFHIITKVVMRMQAWLGYLTSP